MANSTRPAEFIYDNMMIHGTVVEAIVIPQLRMRSSAALLAENHSEVPNNWARTMTETACFMVTHRERSVQDNLPGG